MLSFPPFLCSTVRRTPLRLTEKACSRFDESWEIGATENGRNWTLSRPKPEPQCKMFGIANSVKLVSVPHRQLCKTLNGELTKLTWQLLSSEDDDNDNDDNNDHRQGRKHIELASVALWAMPVLIPRPHTLMMMMMTPMIMMAIRMMMVIMGKVGINSTWRVSLSELCLCLSLDLVALLRCTWCGSYM